MGGFLYFCYHPFSWRLVLFWGQAIDQVLINHKKYPQGQCVWPEILKTKTKNVTTEYVTFKSVTIENIITKYVTAENLTAENVSAKM